METIDRCNGCCNKRNWRDEAINEALQAERYYSESLDALLLEIRRHQPGCSTLILWPDRHQLMRFLRQKVGRCRSLLQGSDSFIGDEEIWPYSGWYEIEWAGALIEIALSPDYGQARYIICAAVDEAVLHRFARSLDEFGSRPAGRCLRYTQGWESATDLDEEIGKVTWDDVVLPPEMLRSIRDAVEGFFNHRDAFAALGFAWRRGMLLVGPPGTGKTMVCKAAAAALTDLPFLYVRDLREDRKKEAIRWIFERARKLAPCILSFEDLDGLVNEYTRTVFLNELDGFESNEGIFVIASSNHPGKIDEALLKRPSRFDRVFHLGLPALPERREYCLRVLSRSTLAKRLAPSLDRDALAQQVAERSDGFTPAYLKEALVAAALQRAQEGTTILDERFADAVLAQVEELRQHLKRAKNPDALAEMRTRDDVVGFRR